MCLSAKKPFFSRLLRVLQFRWEGNLFIVLVCFSILSNSLQTYVSFLNTAADAFDDVYR